MGISDLDGLLDAIGDPILVLVEDRVVYTNRAAAEFLGAPKESILGTSLDDWLAGSASVVALRTLGQERAVVEFRRRDDDVVALRMHAPKAVSFDGSDGVMLVGTACERESRSAGLLERLVVVNRLTTLGALVAGIGRELHTYLTAVGDNLDELGEQVRTRLGPIGGREMTELVEATMLGADQLRLLASDVGSLSAGREAEAELLDLADLVRRSLRLVRAEVGRRARLVERYLPQLPLVWANPVRLSQVVLNLMLNAVRALPGASTADSSSIVVEVGADAVGDLVLAVSDTGMGLPNEALEALAWDPQTGRPLDSEPGLGLYLSREIVRELGGDIELDTEEGRGTTMFVTLPAADLSGHAAPRVH